MHDQQLGTDDARRAAIQTYYGLISFLDDHVGQILNALEETGAVEDTLIIYRSDHGECLGNRGAWGKSVVYIEASRVPMIVAGRGLKPGVSTTPVSLINLPATLCAHFNVTWEGGRRPREHSGRA
ncbi:MAG: sulfatase-like hydrolase/transferase [Rhodobacteraceae bacterium]|nr:sulfatase-like hydrolase/transferase [Paracoccaceae bacterium]